MDRRILLVIAVGVVAITCWVVWWFVRLQTPSTSGVPADHWQWTGSCYVAIGSPTTEPPGQVCGSTNTSLTGCFYNDEEYAIGERFAATDGCNTCTCDADTRSVICTEIACAD